MAMVRFREHLLDSNEVHTWQEVQAHREMDAPDPYILSKL